MPQVYWLALSFIPGIGGVTARRLLARFGSLEAAFAASDAELLALPRITGETVAQLRALSLGQVEAELAALRAEGIEILTWDDAGYPSNLHQLGDAPFLLYVHGTLLPADTEAVAIVGTRQPSAQAVNAAEMIACELAGRGLTVVSGLALGVDTAAHRGALRAAGGRTLAVLGSGLHAIHPRSNQPLAEAIRLRGALLSELPPATRVCGPNLMARDRLIGGLSRAVIVVEAAEKSGSFDTAMRALRQGRLLLAVPGSPGTEVLLAAGAGRLEPACADWDALAQRIRGYEPGSERQLSLL